MENNKDKVDTAWEKVAALFNSQRTILLVVVAILSLSVSFFTAGIVRVVLGLICVACSFVIIQRAVAKSAKDRWGDSYKK
jgi:tetrahydromethanopterin S-methyltransferase subunit E